MIFQSKKHNLLYEFLCIAILLDNSGFNTVYTDRDIYSWSNTEVRFFYFLDFKFVHFANEFFFTEESISFQKNLEI